jgi:phytoene synthase
MADVVAHHLGRALQLTNILRDIAEDARRDRLYLPREILQRHGIETTVPQQALAHANLRPVCREVAAMARQHFESAYAAMRQCDKTAMRPAAVMGAMYRAILDKLILADWRDPSQPVSVPKWRKIWIALRYGFL